MLFLHNGPYVDGPASTPGPGDKAAGNFAVLPVPRRPGPPDQAFPLFALLTSAILAAKPRPGIASCNHRRLAVSCSVHQALATGQPAAATIAALPGGLKPILQNGDNPHGPPPKITKSMGGNPT